MEQYTLECHSVLALFQPVSCWNQKYFAFDRNFSRITKFKASKTEKVF